jgi:transposase
MDQVDIWFQDETRVGQQGSLTRIWAPKGTRPRVVRQQQFLYTYIFGAVCPSQGTCAGLILPHANGEGLELHLKEISYHVPEGRHAVVILDQAGWHKAQALKVPSNLSLLHLPPYAPELNPQENVWQYLKESALANRVFASSEHLIQACVQAWNLLTPQLITSIASRNWAQISLG